MKTNESIHRVTIALRNGRLIIVFVALLALAVSVSVYALIKSTSLPTTRTQQVTTANNKAETKIVTNAIPDSAPQTNSIDTTPKNTEPQATQKTTQAPQTAATPKPSSAPLNVPPFALYTSGQSYTMSDAYVASIVEASFENRDHQSRTYQYQVEATQAGQTTVLYSSSMYVESDSTFSIQPPQEIRAYNVVSGDYLRIHLTSPYDTYSKPYNVVGLYPRPQMTP